MYVALKGHHVRSLWLELFPVSRRYQCQYSSVTVLQDVTIERNWVKDTWNPSILFLTTAYESTINLQAP